MRNTAIAVGLFVCSLITLSTVSTSALTPGELLASTGPIGHSEQVTTSASEDSRFGTTIMDALAKVAEPAVAEPETKPEPQREHIVVAGDTLSSVAEQYDTTWRRLYDKNTDIASPDVITAGQKIVIPNADEKLESRAVQDAPVAETATSRSTQSITTAQQSSGAYTARGSSVGNSYYAGYCTWYAKSMRPDMPNNLGNADTWVARAAAQGFATGSTPRAGAIGQQGMHVVYVERVHANGTVTVSEMNYQGYGVVSTRTVPAGTFMYIY